MIPPGRCAPDPLSLLGCDLLPSQARLALQALEAYVVGCGERGRLAPVGGGSEAERSHVLILPRSRSRLEPDSAALRAELARVKAAEQKHDQHMRSALKGLFG